MLRLCGRGSRIINPNFKLHRWASRFISMEPKSPRDSYVEVELPFQTFPDLAQGYINQFGRIRFGLVLEKLDVVAGAIGYLHVAGINILEPGGARENGEVTVQSKGDEPCTIVTASCDNINVMGPLNAKQDLAMWCQLVGLPWTASSP